MDKPYRRYEVLLPLRFNDGESVPDNLISETLLELRERFGAVSCESQTTSGLWQHEGHVYRDDLIRVYVDVPDLPEHRAFFRTFKAQLLLRFRQIDIWLTSYVLDVL